ncbi:MAG: MMPL family transporter, partial [Chloroflexi bacterium]|nr:MMPL family transporter [Chloroflexota bacterium]
MLFALGCWLFRHRWIVLAVWAAALLVALPVAPHVFRALNPGGFDSPDLEAFRASQLLDQRFGSDPASLYLVYTDPPGVSLSPADLAQQVESSLADVRQLPEVQQVVTPAENPRQIAPDGQAAYATVTLSADAGNVQTAVPRLQDALRPTQATVTLTGAPVFYQDIFDVTERDLRRAELLSIPMAAVALVLVFGSLVAGAVPGVVGGTAVAITLALMVLLSQAMQLSIFSLNLATMLGLGLGIDYSLFIVSRFREELRRGESVERAVAWSTATAGRAVLFSGATVMIGLLALLTFDITALRSMGMAGALVVLLSVLAALTLLPAILAVLGARIDAVSIGPLAAAAARTGDGEGFWARLARLVMRRPIQVLVPLLVLLIGLGVPFLRVEFGAPDASILPTDVQSRHGFDLLRTHWGEGELSPVLLVFQTTDGQPVLQPQRVAALADFMRRVQSSPTVSRVNSVVSLDPRITPDQYA